MYICIYVYIYVYIYMNISFYKSTYMCIAGGSTGAGTAGPRAQYIYI